MKSKLILVLILFFAGGIRFYHLDQRGVFTDEKFTLLNANGYWVGAANQIEITQNKYFSPSDFWQPKPFRDYFESIAHSDFGTHIIYNFCIKAWMLAFGNSDWAIRSLSVLFNLLTILLVFLLINKVIKSEKAALLASFLISIEPLNIAISRVARSYSLSFLLVVLATYIFILLLESRKRNQRILLFGTYSLITGALLLNHYLNFFVPLSHALVFLFIKKDKKLWPGFIASGAFCSLLMLWWFTSGGGYLSFDFLKDKNAKHLALAQMSNNPLEGQIQLSTPENVIKKTLSMFFDATAMSHGVYENINGVKIVFATILLFFIFLFAKGFFKLSHKYLPVGIGLVGFIGLFLNWQITLACVAAMFFYYCIYGMLRFINSQFEDQSSKALAAICLLMLVLPLLFVVYDAFKNGHTTSLTHRYIGVASPFMAMLVAISVYYFSKSEPRIYFVVIGILLIQTPNVYKEISSYFKDESSKYAWYEPAREQNPYVRAAELVLEKYSIGDTLLLPSNHKDMYDNIFNKNAGVSYNDVQYLNLYLPKNSKIIERIDPNEKDKFYIVDKSNKKTLIFDLEGSKYRY